ncbi:exosome complex component MTR3 [Pseudohyphozyma bogoriensis]|nr:exosome complex component MTR3 [Pseudohyphozyma bogoriensis]
MSGQAADRRRFNAPPNAAPLVFVEPDAVASSSAAREDSRAPSQVRPVFLQTGLVTEASGSAYIETGRTKLICAVYGPKPTPPSAPFNAKARLNVEVKFAPFSSGVRRFTPGKDTESPLLSSTLHQSLLPSLLLDSLPKSQIDLFVHILESDGSDSDISAGVTAASVALASAGIQMVGLVVGCSAAFLPSAPTPVLDPTRSEALSSTAFVSLACIPALGTITNISSRGTIPVPQFEEAVKSCASVCGDIHSVARQALTESLAA